MTLDLHADRWFLQPGLSEAETAEGKAFAFRFYSSVTDPGSFVGPTVSVAIATLLAVSALLALSHAWPESDSHTKGSTSAATDIFILVASVAAAPYFLLYVEPAEHNLRSAAASASQVSANDEAVTQNLVTIASGHVLLFALILLALFLSIISARPAKATKID